jgi:hypothetical protein
MRGKTRAKSISRKGAKLAKKVFKKIPGLKPLRPLRTLRKNYFLGLWVGQLKNPSSRIQ